MKGQESMKDIICQSAVHFSWVRFIYMYLHSLYFLSVFISAGQYLEVGSHVQKELIKRTHSKNLLSTVRS